MRKSPWILSLVLLVVLGALGCQGSADDADTGGVKLSIVDFDGLPTLVSASSAVANGGLVQVEQMVVEPGVVAGQSGVRSRAARSAGRSTSIVTHRTSRSMSKSADAFPAR